MLFLSPAYFSLLIFIALFILMYFFRKKYEQLKVPSNFLWEEAMNEQTVSPYLKKLQKNVLFFLQLFILLLLIILLVQPNFKQEKIVASEVVFVLDLSASMDRQEHWQHSKKQALETLEKIQSAKITVIESGSTPKIIFYHETDKRVIENYLENVELHYGKDEKASTFALVKTLLENSNSPIFIFSDDVTKEEVRKTFVANQVYVFNSLLENRASITNFVVGKDNGGFVTMINHLDKELNGKLLVYEKNNIVQELDVSLTPKETKGITLENMNKADYYKAELVLDDSYLIDNKMFYVPTNSVGDVFIQKDVHSFVQKAVQTIYPTSQLVEDENVASEGIIVTNKFLTNATTPFIYLHKGTNKVSLETSHLTITEDNLLDYVDLEEVLILGAYKDLDKSKLDVIVSNNQVPLIAKGQTSAQVPFVVINFDIADSDWPLHISFPVFFYNAISYLQDEQLYSNLTPNEEIVVTTTQKVTIFNEASKAVATFDPLKETIIAPTEPGIYQLNYDNKVQFFSVNIDDTEKNISSMDNFVWNKNLQVDSEVLTENNYEYIRWIILIVFMLLLIEWGVQIRGNRI